MNNWLIFEVEHPKVPLQNTLACRYVVAVMGACIAELVTYPLDLTKTRLQIQNEMASAQHGFKMEHQGMLSAVKNIVLKEGPLKLWSGLLPMCQRHVVYAGCRLVLYENLRVYFVDEKNRMSLPNTVFCGATCGATAQFMASPADLIKVQVQTEGRRKLQGLPPRYSGYLDMYKSIYKKNGILGFWRGALPNMQRAAMINIGDLAAYDYAKQFFKHEFEMDEGLKLHSLSAVVAGFVAAVLGTPADLIKTRLMNQPVGPDGKGQVYSGMIDCIQQSVKNEGLFSLYKGFMPLWIRLGPWALINWLAFENIIKLIGGKEF